VGGLFTRDVDQQTAGTPTTDNYWMWQSFAAVQYVLFQQLYIKLVASYAHSHFALVGNPPSAYDDEDYSVRLRFAFYF